MSRVHDHPGGGPKPTVRQIYAVARLLLDRDGERWPATRSEASALIERLKGEEDAEG